MKSSGNPSIPLFEAPAFADYSLIDCGNFEKLERFGQFYTIRPEPQAVWEKRLSEKEWEKLAHVKFIQRSSSSGDWQRFKQMPDNWNVSYPLGEKSIKARLALTSFKHVGIFPEQAANWDFIYHEMKKTNGGKFLNLFAYTGMASLAAKAAGADVIHVDSIKQVVSWSRKNMELSGLDNIRWVVEDALKFVKREARRGNSYEGIILDPPAYGHGPGGEKWKLEDNIREMIETVTGLLNPKGSCFILNTYSLGFSSLIIENLLQGKLPDGKAENGELYLKAETGVKLPLGVLARFSSL